MAFSYPIPLNIEGIQINKACCVQSGLCRTWQDPLLTASSAHTPTTKKNGCIPEAEPELQFKEVPTRRQCCDPGGLRLGLGSQKGQSRKLSLEDSREKMIAKLGG